MVSINLRGSEANNRSEPGHLEGDLICGTRPSAVATLVDRQSRAIQVVALTDGYRAETVALITYLTSSSSTVALSSLPAHLRRSLTWDRGWEMAEHERITAAALDMPVYVCPASSVATQNGRK